MQRDGLDDPLSKDHSREANATHHFMADCDPGCRWRNKASKAGLRAQTAPRSPCAPLIRPKSLPNGVGRCQRGPAFGEGLIRPCAKCGRNPRLR